MLNSRMINGNESIISLYDLLINSYGELGFILVGEISDETDAIGWKMTRKSNYLFSVSTLAGELPLNTFDLQISVSDQSIHNGEICINEEVTLNNIKVYIEGILRGTIT